LHVTVATIVWTVNVDSLVIESIFNWLVLKSSLYWFVFEYFILSTVPQTTCAPFISNMSGD